jgi:hypothetical protein
MRVVKLPARLFLLLLAAFVLFQFRRDPVPLFF